MQLTQFSDYAFRALLTLGEVPAQQLTSVQKISDAHAVSHNHMVKVVNRLGHAGFVTTVRGKGGGVRLAMTPADIVLGKVLRALEPLDLVDCHPERCRMAGGCRLKGVLAEATNAFLSVMDNYTLADLLDQPGLEQALVKLVPSAQ